jgi:hypothetical protein
MISEPVVRSAQTVHVSCVKICSISKWTESSIHFSLVTKQYHQVRPKGFLSMWYVRHIHCFYLASRLALYQINWIKHPLELCHLGVLSRASKTISEPTVHLAQTVHLSWTDTNTISKWTKTRFHMTHVTLEFHRVHLKWFLRLWYFWHKPCTYLTSRLALFSNRLNRASTSASSPRCTIGCVQKQFLSQWYVQRKLWTHLASRLALSPNELNQASIWASSPRSTIRCIQNDFWAFGTFGTNHAPIMHQD